ncbi:1-acyl-sn-glycerol-3-phosphate acyltransferase [Pseudorhodobacter turbinis]|uniref:1-acyl-sn-glycerol-3-phosphate acyltransferase n=1 Tax=Pseudorhodobacter turbinis TaxID=2500533 RepID=A0A4P8EH32_9RHOB|nr:lysophospholipid acyltransferase family protein [Pseudorhodobacter turbinis]QCO56246.1 1-acyl-sn-glycerol-3-phosphate acyltransferase [Pseudorhodobacter turbinis]
MRYALQWLLSLIFIVQMYIALFVVGILYLPYAIVSRKGALAGCHAFAAWVMFSLRWLTGMRTEVRGTPPTHAALVAAKHQSFLDVLMIFHAMPRGRFIMKRELMYAPVVGWFGLRIGCVPVDRGKRGAAIMKMMADVKSGVQQAGQLIIYSQGTRIAPGVKAPYKAGTAALYAQLAQDCVPVATNVGVLWPKHGIMRKRGVAVVEFLPTIPPGLPKPEFMERLEREVEAASDALMAEAGFTAPT